VRSLPAIGFFALAALPLPWLTSSGTVLNLATMVLLFATLGQAWNLLGGMAGQFSFGHAAFFGTGAYATAIAQIRFGLDAWSGFALAILAAVAMGALVGFASFRFRLRGSYFALVTLAFAEVARILANSLEITGAGVGLLLPLAPGLDRLQFADKAGYYWFALVLCTGGLVLASLVRESRLGARLAAVRENEEAARALGVDAFAVKMQAILLSAGLAGAVGAFYTQLFLYLDPHIAFGPQVSVEALLGPIVGGTASLWGPVLGAAVLQLLGEASRALTGGATGANLVAYGIVLVLIVRFFPDGIIGMGRARAADARGVTG
jgi:branched-chain amino acid transport system permease protein